MPRNDAQRAHGRATRAERAKQRSHTGRRRTLVVAGAAVLVTALVAGAAGAVVFGQRTSSASARAHTLGATFDRQPETQAGAGAAQEASATASVEVPEVAGKTVGEARTLLEALGLAVEVRGAQATEATVTAQHPEAHALVPQGTAVVLVTGNVVRVLQDGGPTEPNHGGGFIVVIDPGHQSKGDQTPEPIGPGATETKARVTGGTSGVVTRIPEYEVVLQISTNLKARLEAAGVTVIMTRTTNDVNISNAERAAAANTANADLFVRVHADGSTDPSTAGISTLYPGANRWTGPIVDPSKRAAARVQEATVAATGATSRGTTARTDLSGFNWAKVPSVLVECGFMSNAVEDRLLSSPHYQDKLAEGMAQGIIAYLTEGAD